MEPVSADIYLGTAISRESLLHACRLLSKRVSSWLEKQGLVWQRLTVCLDLEGKRLSVSREFSRAQAPRNLCLHMEGIIRNVEVTSPVEKISVTLDWLSRAPVSQLTMFNGKDPEKENRLRKAVAAVSRVCGGAVVRASELMLSRRERMLTFYDPWRCTTCGANISGILEQKGNVPVL